MCGGGRPILNEVRSFVFQSYKKASVTRNNGAQKQQTMAAVLLQGKSEIILMKVKWTFLLASLLLLPTSTSGSASEEFENLQNDFMEWKKTKYPYHFQPLEQDNRLNSYSLKGYREEKEKISEYLKRLQLIWRKDLPPKEVLIYDVMNQMLEQKVQGYKWHLYGALNPLSFLENVITPNSLIELSSDYDENQVRNLLSLLGDVDRLLDEYKALMKEAIKNKHTLHNVSVTPVYQKLVKLSEAEMDDKMYSLPKLNEYIDKLPLNDERKDEFKLLANRTMADIKNAYISMAQFFKDEYLPNTRPHISISSLQNGRQLYDAYLKWHLSTSMSADEIYDLGHSEISRIYKSMKKIMDKQNFNGTVLEYFQSLAKRPEFFLETKEDIVNRYKLLIQRIKAKLNTTFRDYPDLPLDIVPMSYDGPAALYRDGSKTGEIRGTFVLNLYRPQEMPTYQMMALALHETIPGHHLQRSYSRVSDMPLWKSKSVIDNYFLIPFQFPFNTAYLEGWGLYSEYLGEEMGLYETDYDLMGRYSFEIFRACRLAIDTGIHAKNMTREEGINLLMKYTGSSRKAAEIEVDRYITIPGQACSYKIGEIKIRKLREKAEKALGAAFDIKEFHNTILKTGGIPLEILEQRIEEMIAHNSAPHTLVHFTLVSFLIQFIL